MPPPAEPKFEDDASGEAWFQKGVTLLEGRKQERETEERLRRAMNQSVTQQWQMLPALLLGTSALWQMHRVPDPLLTGLNIFMVVGFVLGAIDNANAKRTQAILDWIEHEREKEQRQKAASE